MQDSVKPERTTENYPGNGTQKDIVENDEIGFEIYSVKIAIL